MSRWTTCPRAWTPVSVRPAHTTRTAGTRSDRGQRLLERALHRPQPRLDGPALEVGPVVGRGRAGSAPAILVALSGPPACPDRYWRGEQPRHHPGLRHHADVLVEQFGRYARDYDLRTRRRRGRRRAPGPRDPGRAAARWRCSSPTPAARRGRLRGHPQDAGRSCPTARRVVVAALGPLPHGRRGAAGRPGQGQVRRLPADAARHARRGVPQRDHRPALRLDGHRPPARGRVGADRLARPRRR